MKYLQLYENFEVLQDGDYLVISLFWAEKSNSKLFLCRVSTPNYMSRTEKFTWNKMVILEGGTPKSQEIEIYQDIQTGKFYHSAGIGANGIENTKYEFKILYKSKDHEDALNEYKILSDARSFGI